ncbi:hypothetical protein [Flavobacterium terrisoli]|uniref:hypothetical protein n=1 Tax=Flavobacterium terrisoli TaxID=3242195 RepID=UPI00254379FC|nr:hypothetical protein [Flavobacterium buctense]
MEHTINIENRKWKTRKFWKLTFYVLVFFPALFIVSLLTFYTHAGLINGYRNISGINPFEFKFYDVYQYCIIYSWTGTVFSFLAWIIIALTYFIKRENGIEWKSLLITFFIYIIALTLALSKIMEFAMD